MSNVKENIQGSNNEGNTLQIETIRICKLFSRNEDSTALLELGRLLEKIQVYSPDIPPIKQTVLQNLMSRALLAIQNKDYVNLSDLLEYGIIPLIIQKNQDDNDGTIC